MTAEALTIAHLERWALSGAHWRVVEIAERHAVVDLCACTGELVERRDTDDDALVGYLHEVRSDLDLA